jgi:hypothetical protein
MDPITTTEVKIFSVPGSEAIGIELKVIKEITHGSQGKISITLALLGPTENFGIDSRNFAGSRLCSGYWTDHQLH